MIVKISFFLPLLIVLCSCANTENLGDRKSDWNPRPGPGVFKLTIQQDEVARDFVVKVQNISEEVADFSCMEGLFEGEFIFVQEGAPPFSAYQKDYLHIVLRGIPASLGITLEPKDFLEYRIPVNSLVFFPPGDQVPNGNSPLFVYLKSKTHPLVSNAAFFTELDKIKKFEDISFDESMKIVPETTEE